MRIFLYFVLFYLCFLNLSNFKIDDSLNRRIYSFNRGFDKSFLNPSVTIYIKVCPSFIDNSLSNFINNMSEVNNLFFLFFKSDLNSITNSLYRFFLNFYFGFLGFLDIAQLNSKSYRSFDFQIFMFLSGFKDFIYMMIPFVGPSTLYFNFGLIILHVINPYFYFFDTVFFYYFLEILNKKSIVVFDINFFHSVMIDGYTFLKDIYLQNIESLFNIDSDNFLFEPPD